jgi:hypothetical protein
LIIPMIIQTILLDPSGAGWTDAAPNLSRQDPSCSVQSDAEHLARNRKVEGSNPTPVLEEPQFTACTDVHLVAAIDPHPGPI